MILYGHTGKIGNMKYKWKEEIIENVLGHKSIRYGNKILNFGKIGNFEYTKNRENREIRIEGENKENRKIWELWNIGKLMK